MKIPKPVNRVLFVCYGNLCRSVLAEAIMEDLLARRGLEHIDVASAGIGAFPNSPAPERIVEVARDHGLDVSGHRSTPLDAFLFDWADIILVMEAYMRDDLERVWPEKDCDKMFLLSQFARGNIAVEEIDDPYGGSAEEYERCFDEIEMSVRGLVEALSPQGDPQPISE